jgi:hypothetical protein
MLHLAAVMPELENVHPRLKLSEIVAVGSVQNVRRIGSKCASSPRMRTIALATTMLLMSASFGCGNSAADEAEDPESGGFAATTGDWRGRVGERIDKAQGQGYTTTTVRGLAAKSFGTLGWGEFTPKTVRETNNPVEWGLSMSNNFLGGGPCLAGAHIYVYEEYVVEGTYESGSSSSAAKAIVQAQVDCDRSRASFLISVKKAQAKTPTGWKSETINESASGAL